MKSDMKKSIHLYHTSFVSNRFKYSFIIELVCWLLLGYFLQFQSASSIQRVGVIIQDHENNILVLIKILLPMVIYVLLLGFTQYSIYNFLNHDKATLLYKMIPHSFHCFKQNLIGTYSIACIALPVCCILYILMFYPTYFVLAPFVFSIMLLMSVLIIYVGLYKESSFLLWDVFIALFFIIIIFFCMLLNEHYVAYQTALTIVSIAVYSVSVLITFKILNKILHHMKEVWLQ